SDEHAGASTTRGPVFIGSGLLSGYNPEAPRNDPRKFWAGHRGTRTGAQGETMWNQVYDPFANQTLSTLAAAIPVVLLLVLLASGKVKAHLAALIALLAAIVIAIVVFTMPSGLAIRAGLLGIATGLFPIGWIVLNVLFLYQLTVESGIFVTLQQTIAGVTADRRLQGGFN